MQLFITSLTQPAVEYVHCIHKFKLILYLFTVHITFNLYELINTTFNFAPLQKPLFLSYKIHNIANST